jgi:alpha-galactosidase
VRRLIVPAVLAALVLSTGAASAQGGRSVEPGPPMGWSSRLLGCAVDERAVRQAAGALVSTGLAAKGYRHVLVDDCWAAPERDAGQLIADPARFPAGMAARAEHLHGLGLALGLNLSAGTRMCTRGPGSYGREAADAARLASWGVDLVKYDWCAVPLADFPGRTVDVVARELSGRMSAGLGRAITLSLNMEDGSTVPWTWAAEVATTWRTNVYNRPLADDYDAMVGVFEFNMLRGAHARPGGWNDPDVLRAGGGGMTAREYQTQLTLWAVMAAPLYATGALGPDTAALLGNPDVIAVDQDPRGAQGRFAATDGWHHVIAKPLAGGDVAVALFNESDRSALIETSARQVGLAPAASYRVRDLWTGATARTTGAIVHSVPAHGAVLLRVGRSPASAAPLATVAVEAPPLIEESDRLSILEPGWRAGVTTSVTNTGGTAPLRDVTLALAVPAGWTARPTGPVTPRRLAAGHRHAVTWRVTPPPGTPPGVYELTADGGAAGRATTEVRVASAPGAGTAHLGDVPWTASRNHLGPVERDRSNGDAAAGDGRPITINGVRHERGLGVHAPSEVELYTGGRCTEVRAEVGVDDEVEGGSVVFGIWADGELAARTGIVTGADAAVPLRADVSGAAVVRLVVTNGGDNAYFDHADWASATITCT